MSWTRSHHDQLLRVIKVGGSLYPRPDLPARFVAWLRGLPPALNLVVIGGGEVVNGLRLTDERRFGRHFLAELESDRARLQTPQREDFDDDNYGEDRVGDPGFALVRSHWLAIGAMRLMAGAFAQRLLREAEHGVVSSREIALQDPRLDAVLPCLLTTWTVPAGSGLEVMSSVSPRSQSSRQGTQTLLMLDPVAFMRLDAATPTPLPESWRITSDSIAARAACRTNADELVLVKSVQPATCGSAQELAQAGFVDEEFPLAVLPFVRSGGCFQIATLPVA